MLLCGDRRLASLEKRYLGEIDAYGKLAELFDSGRLDEYELVLIDSPPSLGVMTLNGLATATHLVIPLRAALYSLIRKSPHAASRGVRETSKPSFSSRRR